MIWGLPQYVSEEVSVSIRNVSSSVIRVICDAVSAMLSTAQQLDFVAECKRDTCRHQVHFVLNGVETSVQILCRTNSSCLEGDRK